MGDAKWKPLIQGDPEDFARLGASGDRRAVEPLIKALGNEDPNVRRIAAKALKSLGEANWRTMVKGDEEDLARLGVSGDTRVVPVLIKCLSYPSRTLRLSAARGLIQISTSNPALLRASWQQVAQLLSKPHTDAHYNGEWQDWSHRDEHQDTGIGLDFPEQPPSSAQ